MRSRHRFRVALAAIPLSLPLVAVGQAAPAQAGCFDHVDYSVTATDVRMPFGNLPTFRDGPGGTISVTRDFTSSVSYGIELGAEAEVNAVLTKAKVSVSATLTKTNSSTVTHNYSHVITPGKMGNVQYVSYGKRVSWAKYHYNTSCGRTLLSTGRIRYPSSSEGWFYWETAT